MPLLEKEIKAFENRRAELIKSDKGRWALFKDDKLVGIYDTQRDAYSVGIDKCGLESFLIKKITIIDVPVVMTNLMRLHA